MNLTVTARIAGGAGLVILLLALLVFNGLSGVNNINDGLVSVTEQSTPMLVEEGEIVQTLLYAAAEVNYYHQSLEPSELASIAKKYEEQVQKNKSARSRLASLADNFPNISAPLSKSQKSIKSYLKIVPKSFDSHQKDVGLRKDIANKLAGFEDVADELDSLLFDFSDEVSNKKIAGILQSLSNMVREATITVTDVLAISQRDQVSVAANDIKSLIADFENKFKQVANNSGARSNEYYSDTSAAITRFKNLVVGNYNILNLLQSQLDAKYLAKQQLVESGQIAKEALANLKKVSNSVKDLTASIKKEANENVSSSRTLIIGFAIVAIIVAIGINFWVLQSIRNPLAEVLRVMTKVSDGDLREQVEVRSSDEIGKLSEGFNQLINQLSSMLNEITSSSQQLSAAAEQTSAISSQSHKNINKQKEQTDMMATAMTQMTATVDEVAASATNTAKEVRNADQEAIEGQKIVQKSIDSINGLADEIEKAAKVID